MSQVDGLKLLAGATLALGVGGLLYASLVETRNYKIESLSLTISGGTGSGGSEKPLRILHLSDLHLCYPETHKVDFLQHVTSYEYDLVILTGDIFENYTGLIYAQSILARPPRLGAYAVLGNHDYYDYRLYHKIIGRLWRPLRHPPQMRDVGPMVKALEKSGFQVLRHEAVKVPEAGLLIAGIDYPGLAPERLAELVSRASQTETKIVLFHLPVNLKAIVDSGAHLAFGGHTHGGQIRIPGLGAIITDSELPRKEASGLFYRGRTAFHISRGLGAGPQTNFRLFCPPAATVLEVTRKVEPEQMSEESSRDSITATVSQPTEDGTGSADKEKTGRFA